MCNVEAYVEARAGGGGRLQADGWRQPSVTVSLPEVHGSVPVPLTGGFWRKMLAFAGPGYLVAVGYMDPGNWATDLAGGSKYGYTLLSVIMLSNLMAILLQALAPGSASPAVAIWRRPVATIIRARDAGVVGALRIAIAACDLAEVIGSAIALNLLFGLPLIWGVCLTSLDVLLVLYLQQYQFRYVEALVLALILGIAGCFAMHCGSRSRICLASLPASCRARDRPQSRRCSTSRSASWARR